MIYNGILVPFPFLDENVKPGIRRAFVRIVRPEYTIERVIRKKLANGDSWADALISEGKEIIFEDTPVLNWIYDVGKSDGKKEGIKVASDEYDKKFCELTNMFLTQNMVQKQQEEGYNKLLADYHELIEKLKNKLTKTEKDNKNLMILLETERKLRELPKVE